MKSRRIGDRVYAADWVIDAGIGKGQDLGRYTSNRVKNLVGLDNDRGALSELVHRNLESSYARGGKSSSNRRERRTRLYYFQVDLKEPYGAISRALGEIEGFPREGAGALVSNLAVHYLAGTDAGLRNFAALAAAVLRPGGVVVITAMMGKKVHDLLSANKVEPGGVWDSHEGEVRKYAIRRDYREKSLTPVGQQVSVLLPFSNGALYPEFLVNFDFLEKVFDGAGFDAQDTGGVPFDQHFDKFETSNPRAAARLTEADKAYLALYGEIIFTKRSASPSTPPPPPRRRRNNRQRRPGPA